MPCSVEIYALAIELRCIVTDVPTCLVHGAVGPKPRPVASTPPHTGAQHQ